MYAWDYSVGSLTGFRNEVHRGRPRLRVCYVPPNIKVAGTDTSHFRQGMEDWPAPWACRAFCMATMALLYDACMMLRPACTTLAGAADHVVAQTVAAQRNEHGSVKVRGVATTRYNWLPFTEEEADLLAWGTKVSVDSLPAVVAVVRRQQPDFDIAESADLRVLFS